MTRRTRQSLAAARTDGYLAADMPRVAEAAATVDGSERCQTLGSRTIRILSAAGDAKSRQVGGRRSARRSTISRSRSRPPTPPALPTADSRSRPPRRRRRVRRMDCKAGTRGGWTQRRSGAADAVSESEGLGTNRGPTPPPPARRKHGRRRRRRRRRLCGSTASAARGGAHCALCRRRRRSGAGGRGSQQPR